MKKQTKGILAFAFLGGIMLTSGVLIAIPGYDEDVDYAAMNDPEVTITGTPADNYPDVERSQFCSSIKLQNLQSLFKNLLFLQNVLCH